MTDIFFINGLEIVHRACRMNKIDKMRKCLWNLIPYYKFNLNLARNLLGSKKLIPMKEEATE